MENRIYNFAAGPSMLADEVLNKLHEEFYNYEGSGMAVMEMSHRSKGYLAIFEDAKKRLRDIMEIPEDYEIFFMHGGATGQFAAVPMNLLRDGKADYIVTGNFSNKAAKEAQKYGTVHIAYDGKNNGYSHIPAQEELDLSEDARYVHLCSNNTIYGTEWKKYPDVRGKILVGDLSSDILSRRINVKDFGLIYAGAQKNIGIAGIAVVIIRKDLICEGLSNTPDILSYALMAKHDSMLNTPATYPIYVLGKVLKWIQDCGGIDEIEKRNIAKAKLLYDYLDSQAFYKPHAEKGSRSLMNITFVTPSKELDEEFAKQAAQNGLCNLKGHRLVGGIRASIYNAMPIEGVKSLISFMDQFAKENS